MLPDQAPVRVLLDRDTAALRQLELGRTIFHFGNNPDHAFLIPLFLRFGGIAVIHDTTLHYLAECANATMPGFFDATLAQEHGALASQLTRTWRIPNFKRGFDYQEAKLLSWLKHARAIVVHSEYAARLVGSRLPGIPIHVIPHFAYPPNVALSQIERLRLQARATLGFATDQLVIATLGFVTSNKQYGSVIRAILQLPEALRSRVTFIVAGQMRPQEYDLSREIGRLGAQPFVKMTGYLTEAQMREVLLASDLVCNLRYPTFGESSGSVARGLGLGCAVIITDTGSYAEFPQPVCFRVPGKPDPSAELAAIFRQAIEDRSRLNAVRSSAYTYAKRALHPATAAERYADLASN